MEKIAVIGGLGTLSGGDLLLKLLKNKEVLKNQSKYYFSFEQQPYKKMDVPLYHENDIKSRKFYAFSICKNFEQKEFSKILLPCFASHSFLNELQEEVSLPIVNMFEALSHYLKLNYKKGSKIGILTSDFVKNLPLITTYFEDYELVFPQNQTALMDAIYGTHGIKNGYLDGLPLEYIYEECNQLLQADCDVILPCITELSLITNQLWKRGISIIDVNQVYADYALSTSASISAPPFKLGIVGGVGPTATVDFMNKVILNTPAHKDQDHIKMIVDQNPQIPDRTANLIHNETDPTIALFSTCKRLEAAGVNAIAIPCNTAHAYVKAIQSHLKIPIINMLSVTASHISENFGNNVVVGLLATSGTVASRVYHHVLNEFGFDVLIPDETHQDLVMESIYGKEGVKAGFVTGNAKNNILQAANYLITQGADILILGCTELPLLFPLEKELDHQTKTAKLIDPTLILAKEIITLSKGSPQLSN